MGAADALRGNNNSFQSVRSIIEWCKAKGYCVDISTVGGGTETHSGEVTEVNWEEGWIMLDGYKRNEVIFTQWITNISIRRNDKESE